MCNENDNNNKQSYFRCAKSFARPTSSNGNIKKKQKQTKTRKIYKHNKYCIPFDAFHIQFIETELSNSLNKALLEYMTTTTTKKFIMNIMDNT